MLVSAAGTIFVCGDEVFGQVLRSYQRVLNVNATRNDPAKFVVRLEAKGLATRQVFALITNRS